MRLSDGMESMVFSNAYYLVKDIEKVFMFFRELERKGLFAIQEFNVNSQKMNGTFIRDYPEGHWNALAHTPGAKQVVGGAEIKEGKLTIDTKTKSSLVGLKNILETELINSIEFQREEFEDVIEMLKKK